jgi:hypothetical protein
MTDPDIVTHFLAALKNTRRITAAGTATLSPIILAFLGVAPPWPPGVAKMTAIFALFLSMVSLYSLLNSKKGLSVRRLRLNAMLLCVLLPLYLVVLNLFTFKIPTTGEVTIVGCGYTENAMLVARANHFDESNGCPGSYERMLEAAQYNSYEMWENIHSALHQH